MNVDIDMNEVRSFAADMMEASQRVVDQVPRVVERGGFNIKSQLQEDLRGSGNAGFRYVASTVSYDMLNQRFTVEVGPSKPAGALANVAFFGTYKGGGTVAPPETALAKEEPNFLRELERLAGDFL